MASAGKFISRLYWKIPASKHPYFYLLLYTLFFTSIGLVLALQDTVFRPFPERDDLFEVRGKLSDVVQRRRGIAIVVVDEASGEKYLFPGKRSHLNTTAADRRIFEESIGHQIYIRWTEEIFPFSLINARTEIWDLRVRGHVYRNYQEKLQGTRENYVYIAAVFYASLVIFLFALIAPWFLYRTEALLDLQEGEDDH
jgi:hypothetical protein